MLHGRQAEYFMQAFFLFLNKTVLKRYIRAIGYIFIHMLINIVFTFKFILYDAILPESSLYMLILNEYLAHSKNLEVL